MSISQDAGVPEVGTLILSERSSRHALQNLHSVTSAGRSLPFFTRFDCAVDVTLSSRAMARHFDKHHIPGAYGG